MNKNTDLWKKLQNEIHRQKNVQFSWVKGHNNNPFNEICDKLATEAIRNEIYTKDAGYDGARKNVSQKQPEIPDTAPVETTYIHHNSIVNCAVRELIGLNYLKGLIGRYDDSEKYDK